MKLIEKQLQQNDKNNKLLQYLLQHFTQKQTLHYRH